MDRHQKRTPEVSVSVIRLVVAPLVNRQKERSSKDDARHNQKVDTEYPDTASNGPAADEPRGEVHQKSETTTAMTNARATFGIIPLCVEWITVT